MIPQAIALVPLLAIWQSASAIDIAMNALATVFILEVDNLLYEHALPGTTRLPYLLHVFVGIAATTAAAAAATAVLSQPHSQYQ